MLHRIRFLVLVEINKIVFKEQLVILIQPMDLIKILKLEHTTEII